MAKNKKKKNPQDTTLRNARAAKARTDRIARRLAQLEQVLYRIVTYLDQKHPGWQDAA